MPKAIINPINSLISQENGRYTFSTKEQGHQKFEDKTLVTLIFAEEVGSQIFEKRRVMIYLII